MASVAYSTARNWGSEVADHASMFALRPLHWLISSPSIIFLTALAAMLLRPPNIDFYAVDRIALGLLVFTVLLRASVLRQSFWIAGPVTWPLLALLLLAFAGVVQQPYDSAAWSLFAAKWLVPFVLYQFAGFVFSDQGSLQRLETFALLTLGYLLFIAVAFLTGMRGFILPAFILDESIGIHAERARGPFLQAVANGVTINMLGLVALDSYRRGRLRGAMAVIVMLAFPLAILATKTRAVWLSSATSLGLLLVVCRQRKVRQACKWTVLAIGVGVLLAVSFGTIDSSLSARLDDRSPLDYRAAVYEAGWQMFMEKPLFGWSPAEVQPELAARIRDFRVETYILHNTYLEIAVEHGLLGLALYLWVVFSLFRLGRQRRLPNLSSSSGFLDRHFRAIWPVVLVVFLINASFVVMNYQFVNGLLFTLAGILAAQNRRAEVEYGL